MMGAKNLDVLKTYFDSINTCFMFHSVYAKLLCLLAYLRVFLCKTLKYIFGFQVGTGNRRNELSVPSPLHEQTERSEFQDSNLLLFPSREYDREAVEEDREGESESSIFIEANSDVPKDGKSGEGETDSSVLMGTDYDIRKDIEKREGGGNEGSIFADVKKIDEDETDCSVFMGSDSAVTTSRYKNESRKDISIFMEEPTALSFTFREFYNTPKGSSVSDKSFVSAGFLAENGFTEPNSEELEEETIQEERGMFISNFASGESFRFETDLFGGSDYSSDDDDFHFFNDSSLPFDSKSESSSCSSSLISSNSSGIVFEFESPKVMREKIVEDFKGNQYWCDRNSEDEYIEMELHVKDKDEKEGLNHGEESTDESDSDEEDDDDDFEYEDHGLLEQLELEMRIARQGGLATILEEDDEFEETESPKVVQLDQIKPLEIEEKLEYKDQIVEIQKVYRSYAEKMWKLDVLNYQTMHAIGLLQLKDPFKLISTPKSTVQGAKPSISQNLWPSKAPKNISDPLQKSVNELNKDLELVYVGQVCLSWEILCWQHNKAHELKQYDSPWSHRYNLVTDEFQLFQVLMQRFVENEPFQGPRIQSYVKNRCVIRNLLQVPAIKDDSRKDKNKIKGGEEDAISSEKFAGIIKDSMGVFWEFIRADKEHGNMILKVPQLIGTDDFKDPSITDLLVDIRNQIHKKERKLKEIVRSSNCIVRKFQKHQEEQLNHQQLLAQVGLKLISGVINMKRLSKDQLIWCNEKLKRIQFVGRKIQVEHSFLPFPC